MTTPLTQEYKNKNMGKEKRLEPNVGENMREKWEVKTQYLGKMIQLRHLKGNLNSLVVSSASHTTK